MVKRLILLLSIVTTTAVYADEIKVEGFDLYKKSYDHFLENENSFDAIYDLAVASLEVQQTAQALALVKKLLKQRADEPRALLLHAKIYIIQHRYDEAGILLGRILELYPNSGYVKDAYGLVDLIRNSQTNLTSSYVVSAKLGYDSNPLQFNHDDAAVMSYVTLDNPAVTNRTFFESHPKNGDTFSELLAAGDYLHDFGKHGDWFALYDWSLYGKAYAAFSALNYWHAKAGASIGYATKRSGQWTLGNSIGIASSNIDESNHTGGYRYTSYMASLQYNYKISDTTLFTFATIHNQLGSFESIPYATPQYDINGTYIGDYIHYEPKVRHNIDTFFMQLDGQIFSRDKYTVQVFHKDFHTDLNGFYGTSTMYSGSQTPYSNHQESGIILDYDYSYDARLNFIIDFYISTKRYSDHFLPNTPVPYILQADFDSDPLNLLRKDQFGKLTLTAAYKHSDKFISTLSYAFSENKTNFTPAAYIKHELVYALYWMP